MLDFFANAVLWTLAIYGVFEIIKSIVYEKIYNGNKIKEGINIIITVKNGEDYIEGFIRSLLFKILYSKEKYVKEILIMDINSIDKTNEILEKLEEDYECVRVIDLKDYENILESLNT